MQQQINTEAYFQQQQQLQKFFLENPEAFQLLLDPQMGEAFNKLAQVDPSKPNTGVSDPSMNAEQAQ